jgi:protease I
MIMRVLIVSADEFEDTELLVPLYRFREEGIEVHVASPRPGSIRGKHGYAVSVDRTLREVDPRDYDLLLLPGGRAPAALRDDDALQRIVRAFDAEKKPIAAICHGPQILVSAGVLEGRQATCYKTVAPELKDAGARYVDDEVVVDRNLVTSRQPSDLPAFCREILKRLRAREAAAKPPFPRESESAPKGSTAG